MKTVHFKSRIAFFNACIALAMVNSANAQPDNRQESKAQIQEIVVSARRVDESVQSVPVSITAFDAEGLRESGIANPEDLQISTPGVFLSGSGGRQNVIYQIRGQSKALSGPSSPAVVSYFADVPDPTFGSFVPQYDIASVQVLKGPQGTLFGRNTTGGAVLYYPQEPTYEFGGYLSGIGGNYDKRQVQGAVNVPLIDGRAALRIAGDRHKRDPYTENVGTGRDQDDVDTEAFRISLLLEPTNNIRNIIIYDSFESHSNGFGTVLTGVVPEPGTLDLLGVRTAAEQQLAAQRARGPFKVDTDASFDQSESNEREGVTNRTEIDFGRLQLINIFGYRDTSLSYAPNADGMPIITTDGTGAFPAGVPLEYIKARLTQETEQTSNELQLHGTALSERLEWLVGAFWLKSEPNGSQGIQVPFAHIVGTPDAPAGYTFITEESQAVFVNLRYDLSPIIEGLQFELGVRHTEDEIEACTGSGTTGFPDAADLDDCESGNISNIVNTSINGIDSEETTWSVGLNWQANEELFAYVVARHGYRAGGINGPTFSGRLAAFQSFAPETVDDLEVGIRADWQIGGIDIRTNASAFVGYYDDVQSALTGVNTVGSACDPSRPDNPPGISPDGNCNAADDPVGGTLLANIGESKVSGVDLELVMIPTDRLRLHVAANLLDTKTEKFAPPPALAFYVNSEEIPFNNTAEKTVAGGIRYEIPADNRFADEVILNADYYWSDELMYGDIELPSYSLANVRLDFNGVARSTVDLSVFVRNLFDEEYQSGGQLSGGPAIGLTAGIFGPPRMYGAELRYRF